MKHSEIESRLMQKMTASYGIQKKRMSYILPTKPTIIHNHHAQNAKYLTFAKKDSVNASAMLT